MLDRKAALAAADAFLEAETRDWSEDQPVRTVPEMAFADGNELIVPFGSVASLDLGDELAELAGNLPIRVDTVTGSCSWVSLFEVLTYRRRGFDL